MAKNQIFREGTSLSLPVPTGTQAGSAVRVGSINAVTVTAEASVVNTIQLGLGASLSFGENSGNKPGYASCSLEGAYSLPVVATDAVAVGDTIYIEPDNTLTDISNAGANKVFGVALVPIAAAGTVSIPVLLVQPGA
jgi:predicted RecA/RadA family phage recombinase